MFISLFIILFHWVSDFVLQSDEMAKKKSQSNRFLLYHVLTYGAGMVPVMLLCFIATDDVFLSAGWLIMNMMFHFFVDYFTSRWASKLYKEQRIHDYYVVLGFDQVIHYFTLILTFQYLILQ